MVSRKEIDVKLKKLRLPGIRKHYRFLSERAEKESMPYQKYLYELLAIEEDLREQNKAVRNLKKSKLPAGKTLATFDTKRMPAVIRRQLTTLCEGDFLTRTENILAFGRPGSGKTHLLCAIAHELIKRGYAAYYSTAAILVQILLRAKQSFRLKQEIDKLNRFDAIIIDDIGYVEQTREEMEVLFTLIAERYERKSILLSSNLPFSKWDKIFKDSLTATAVIDRLIHHSVILELNVPSYRTEMKKEKKGEA